MEGPATKDFLGLLSGRMWVLEKAGGGKMLALSGSVNLSKIFFLSLPDIPL